jgi:4-hydroxybenzoate polyprenyltransferase
VNFTKDDRFLSPRTITSLSQETRDFLIHLRIGYQLFVLSGTFLLGGLLSPRVSTREFIVQFFNVHVLLLGGVTAYNSFHDRDEGPIGGIRHPPPMRAWMLPAAWVVQLVGIPIGALAGTRFVTLYSLALVSCWLYSGPTIRLKARGGLDVLVMWLLNCISVGMGYFAYGGKTLSVNFLLSSAGAGLISASFFPVSQLYQIEEDQRRGDKTFAARFGKRGTRSFFVSAYAAGICIVSYTMSQVSLWAGILLAVSGAVIGILVFVILRRIQAVISEYEVIMRIQVCASVCFICYILLVMVITTRR